MTLSNWISIAGIIFVPFLGFLMWIAKKWVQQQIEENKTSVHGVETHFDALRNDLISEIRHATYPISPNANGGKSLPDVAEKLEKVLENQSNQQERLGRLEGILETHLQFHYNG